MAWIGAVAAAAAVQEQMITVQCKSCKKMIRVLENGEGPNTCVGCGMDFCNEHGISYMCDQCFEKLPVRTKELMLSERDKLQQINSKFWVLVVAILVQVAVGMIPLFLGANVNLEFVLVFALLGPIFTAIIPIVIVKLKEEQVRNKTIDAARGLT